MSLLVRLRDQHLGRLGGEQPPTLRNRHGRMFSDECTDANGPSGSLSIVLGSMPPFKLDAVYSPTADQPKAIDGLVEGVETGARGVTLLGATGTGKTMTMAATIERLQRPALVLAHNKTLAAQLCNEFRTYFPQNAVEYFVSLLRLLPARGLRPVARTSTSRRTRRSTRRSTGCATPPRRRCSRGATW